LYDNEEKYLRYFTLADDNECSEEMRELGNELRRKENEDI